MHKHFKTEGIILKRSNLGEADRLLTVFTKHFGKVKMLAKGVRRIKSRRAGSVELFNHVVVFGVKGKSLDLLTEANLLASFQDWRHDLRRVAVAYYFCELVDKLTAEDQEHAAVFALLVDSLHNISLGVDKKVVRQFEERLLDELGFGIPADIRAVPDSLRPYIESIIEKEITAPKILIKLLRN